MEGGKHPVLIPILASLAGTALGKAWDLVKEKMSGKGFSLDDTVYKTDSQKRKLIRHVLFYIKLIRSFLLKKIFLQYIECRITS